jgi:hypothetical protein
MSNKTFKDFNPKIPLADTDYIVGYRFDGTEEFRSTLGNLVDYLKKHFVQRTTFETLKSDWDTAFTLVNILSVDQNTTRNLSASWSSAYSITNSLSSNWNNVYSITTNLSSNWSSAYSTINTLSSSGNDTYSIVNNLSASWSSAYSITNSLSSNWNNVYSITNTFSADWQAVSNLPPPQMNYTGSPYISATNNIDRLWVNIGIRGDNKSLVGCTGDGKILINNSGIDGSVWISSFDNPNGRFSSQWSDIKISDGAIGSTNIGLPFNNSGGLIVALSKFNKDGVVYISTNAGRNWYTSGPSKNRNWMERGLLVSSSGNRIIALEQNGTFHRLNASSQIIPRVNDSNWETISNTPFNTNTGYFPTSIAATSNLNTIYVTAETQLSGAIFKSNNFGSTWSKTNASSNVKWRSVSVGFQPMTGGPSIFPVWAVPYGNNLQQPHVSTDEGNTWTASGPSQFWHSIYAKDSSVIALSRFNNKIYVSFDNGLSWNSPEVITNKQWSSVALSRMNGMNMIHASQESGRLYRAIDDGITWSELF